MQFRNYRLVTISIPEDYNPVRELLHLYHDGNILSTLKYIASALHSQ